MQRAASIKGITAETTAVCCLSGVKLINKSAVGIISSYVPTLKLFSEAFKKDFLFSSIAAAIKV
jgi:hypothetical protein